MIMDADGCNWAYYHGGEQKQGKKIPKWVSRTCFTTYAHSEKTGSRQQMVMVLREDHVEEFRDTKGCAVRNECL